MRTTTIEATIERRILVNYRVDPEALAAILPRPFRPALVGDVGIAGICLIRLGGIRPAGLPADGQVTGVYIPRRDTSSRLGALLGGRLFPGWQHPARFRVEEGQGHFRVEVSSRDGEVQLAVAAHRSGSVMPGSVFGTVDEASEFFRHAPVGYAATPDAGVFDGVALTAEGWAIQPLHLVDVRSSFFEDRGRFPPGTATPDSAFLMAGLDTCWRAQPALVASQERVIPHRAGDRYLP